MAGVWGRGGFQIKATIRLEVIHLCITRHWNFKGSTVTSNSILPLLSALPLILKASEEVACAKVTCAVNHSVKNTGDLGMAVHTCNPSMQAVKAGGP